jgi:UDP-3-O-[3-hydroxymyristoyl] N-acetylglucosamine deacetylase
MIFSRQRTFRQPVRVFGIGLHSGIECSVFLKPAGVSTGVAVQINGGTKVSIDGVNVEKTPRCTRLSDVDGNSVDTPEHLLAALALAGIDNCVIEFNSNEVPILDGCASAWLQHFAHAGIIDYTAPAPMFEVGARFTFNEGGSSYLVTPGPARIIVDIDFDHPVIGRQTIDVPGFQFSSLASSRTFVLEKDVAKLQAAGLALGGSLDNAIVIGDTDVLNPGGFRFDDECARHKALDLIGDMYVLGHPVVGTIHASRPSHSANASFVAAMKTSGALRMVNDHMMSEAA